MHTFYSKIKKSSFTLFCTLFLTTFSIAQPSNDSPCNAIPLTVGTSLSYSSYSNVNATITSGVTAPGCTSFTNTDILDVWFTAVVPSTGVLFVATNAETLNNNGMAIYTGTCNSLTKKFCDDNSGLGIGNSNMAFIAKSTYLPGSTIWIRVWGKTQTTGTFGISAFTHANLPSPGTNIPAGDNCSIASNICNFQGYIGNTATTSDDPINGYTPTTNWTEFDNAFPGVINGDSFISFIAQQSSVNFTIWQTSCENGGAFQYMIFSAANCGFGPVISISESTNAAEFYLSPINISATNLIPGNTYYIAIDGYAGDNCEYIVGLPADGGGFAIATNVTPKTSTSCTNGTITLTASGGNGIYAWSSANMSELSSTSGTTVTITPSSSGTKTYTVNSNSLNTACPSANTASSTITVIDPVVLSSISGSSTMCLNTTQTLSNLVSNGSWSSSDPTIASIDPNSGLVIALLPGNVTMTYSLTSGNCTSVPVTFTINVGNSMNFTTTILNNPTTCLGSDGRISLENLNPTTTYNVTYDFNSTPQTISSIQSSSLGKITISSLAIGVFTNFTISSGGCVGTSSNLINLVAPNTPKVSISPVQPICLGETVTLSAIPETPGGTFAWSTGQGSPTITVTPTQISNVTYSLIYTLNGCDSDLNQGGEITLDVYEVPLPSFTSNKNIGCAPLEITFTNTSTPNGSSASWDFGDGTTANTLNSAYHKFTDVGSQDITLTLSNPGCSSSPLTLPNLITVLGKANADFTVDQAKKYTSDPTFNFTNTSSNATSYKWYFGDSTFSNAFNISHTYPEVPNEYTVKLVVNNQNYCADSIKLKITLVEELIYFIPNTFTPNGDSYNQTFHPVFTSGYDPTSYTLNILNKWGQIIFTSNDINIGWDGKTNGLIGKNDLYNWIIEFADTATQMRHFERGNVTLMR